MTFIPEDIKARPEREKAQSNALVALKKMS